MITALAIDPGKTTGYCLACIPIPGKVYIVPAECVHREADMLELLEGLYVQTDGMLHLVCETFEFRNASRVGLDFTPARLIGIVELFVQVNGVTVAFQNPSVQSDKTGFFSNDYLKQHYLYSVGSTHKRSATKHMLYWLTFKQGAQFAGLDPRIEMVSEDWLCDTYYKGNRFFLPAS